jgi:Ca2+-binding RTX toxin-like protein
MTLARLASGGLVATWLHNGTIVAQLHDSSGARIGAEFSIAFSSQFSPAIGLASGGFVIGWIGVDANGWGAKAKMFDAAGTATSGVINLNQNAPGNQTALTLTALTTGGFAAAWQEYDANFINAGIEARVFNASGVAVTGDISVAASGGNATPTIAALADGNFAVAYSGGTSFAGSVPSNINARVFDLAGNPTGTTFTTNGITAHAKAGNPKLALLSSGDLVLGWVGSNNGTPVEVLTQRFSAAGARVGDAVSVSTAVGAGTSIAVTTTDAGFAVAFGKAIGTDPFNSSAKQTDIAVQLFDTSGTRLGSDFIVNAPSQSEQSKPSIVQFGSGDLAVAFTDYGSDSNGDVSFRLLFDPIIGTSANDTLSGSASADKIDGRAGDDTLNGGAGNDELDGGDGDDTLFGGAGSDQLYGGSGNDILDGGEGADRMSGGIGDDSYYVDNASDVVAENAGAGDDIVYSTVSFVLSDNVEALRLLGSTSINATGNAQNNRLVGNDGNNLLSGGTGDDYLQAGAGDDKLYGEDGNDTLEGGAGDDQLIGGAGNDVLDGGSGLDTAVFSGLFRSYAVNVKGGNGTVSGAKEGTDSLTSIEFLQFKDGKFVFDADGVSAQVTRLYDTVLNRAPDQAGLDLWVDQIEDRDGELVERGLCRVPVPECSWQGVRPWRQGCLGQSA